MALTTDAIASGAVEFKTQTYFSKDRINNDILMEIIHDLDEIEIISVIFLMTNENTNVSELIEAIEEDFRMKFIKLSDEENFKEKILEILLVIGNIDIIKKLGFNKDEISIMKDRFLTANRNHSLYLSAVIKSLYFLCKELTREKVKKLISKVNENLNDENPILEMYILKWIQQNYIDIKDKPNLNRLITNLKLIDCDLSFKFDYWKKSDQNQQDSSQTLRNGNSLICSNDIRASNETCGHSQIAWAKEHKRLCIIVNEINFEMDMFEKRSGSEKDQKRLTKIFKGLQFEIEDYLDLTKDEMIILLDALNTPPYSKYGCIVLIILSHGCEGEVKFVDGESIPIKTIREKVCCKNLKNVFKFIILQCCQGKPIGLVDSELVTDGPKKLVPNKSLDCINYSHLCIFQATISGFAAMRHKTKGSWFIQDICNVLEESSPIEVLDLTVQVSNRLSQRKSPYDDKFIIQLCETHYTISHRYHFLKFRKDLINS